jgi:pimeloyl-ACP methyl ester carboxylesterase
LEIAPVTDEARPGLDRRTILAGAGAALAASQAHAAPRRMPSSPDSDAMRVFPMPPQAPQREGLAHVDGADLYYWDTGGSGPAIVLLHPLSGSGHVWVRQQPILARAGYRVIGYSRRGYCGSSALDPAQPGTAAHDLLGLVDRLGIGTFHAVGSAYGAGVAAAFAMEFPQRLASITLACSSIKTKSAEIERMLDGLHNMAFAVLPTDLTELGPAYRAVDPDGHATWKALHEAAYAGKPAPSQPFGMPVTLEALATLRVPTLLIAGEADLFAPPPIARTFHRIIKGSELVLIREAGHSAHWERPDLFNAALLDFIGRHR